MKDTCEVTITPYAGRPTKVSNVKIVNEPTGLLKKGQDWSLAANVLPAGASNRNVNWSSSDPTVAAIDANGVVHAVSAGRAVIRAILFGLKVRKRSRLRSSWSRMARMQ